MASIGKATMEVDVTLTGPSRRVIALQHAVDTRGDIWSDEAIVQSAQTFLAFLNGSDQ